MKSIGRRQKSRDRAKARDVKKATKNEKKSKSSDDVKVRLSSFKLSCIVQAYATFP